MNSFTKHFVSMILTAVTLLMSCGMMTAFAAQLTPTTLGDLNSDGKITAQDSLLIQRVVIGMAKLGKDSTQYADIDKDGKVTNKDALLILRYTIGYRVDGLPYQTKDGEPEVGLLIDYDGTIPDFKNQYKNEYGDHVDDFVCIWYKYICEDDGWHLRIVGQFRNNQEGVIFDSIEAYDYYPDYVGRIGDETEYNTVFIYCP